MFNINIFNTLECYLVIVCFTVGQALAFVVPVSQEGFLTLGTHKMLQQQTHGQACMVSTSVGTLSHLGSSAICLTLFQVRPQSDQLSPDVLLLGPSRVHRAEDSGQSGELERVR